MDIPRRRAIWSSFRLRTGSQRVSRWRTRQIWGLIKLLKRDCHCKLWAFDSSRASWRSLFTTRRLSVSDSCSTPFQGTLKISKTWMILTQLSTKYLPQMNLKARTVRNWTFSICCFSDCSTVRGQMKRKRRFSTISSKMVSKNLFQRVTKTWRTASDDSSLLQQGAFIAGLRTSLLRSRRMLMRYSRVMRNKKRSGRKLWEQFKKSFWTKYLMWKARFCEKTLLSQCRRSRTFCLGQVR